MTVRPSHPDRWPDRRRADRADALHSVERHNLRCAADGGRSYASAKGRAPLPKNLHGGGKMPQPGGRASTIGPRIGA